MLTKFLKEVVILVVGKQAEPIAELLNSNKHVNEFIIAKKLGITINQTRNILYKISDYGLVSFVRKKDKRKGWYTYFWKIEILKALEFLKSVLLKKTEQIQNQINSRELKQFYFCEKCGIEFSEENALLHDFTCSECGGIFTVKDNTKLLKEFKKNLSRLNKEMELIDLEIEKERGKVDKKKSKDISDRLKEKEKIRKDKLRIRREANLKKIKEKPSIKGKSKKKSKLGKKPTPKNLKKTLKKKVLKKTKSSNKKLKKVRPGVAKLNRPKEKVRPGVAKLNRPKEKVRPGVAKLKRR
ncbi:MAG: hypothetical protein KKB31_02715 [Nanoarchaeota archaeon]|nr:hypothetical protein [Nanoarchaeota archaeon]